MALVANKTEEKGGSSMGLIVTSGWELKDSSALVEETVLLIGKSTGMPLATLGGFVPKNARVGHMKLEAPS